MGALRRTLYAQAGLWAVVGLAMTLAPRLVLVEVLGQPSFPSYVWLRLGGIQSMGLSMVMVLVAHRAEDLWWWSWAFAFVAVATSIVLVLYAAFGVGKEESRLLWWMLSGVALFFAGALLYALAKTSRENPII